MSVFILAILVSVFGQEPPPGDGPGPAETPPVLSVEYPERARDRGIESGSATLDCGVETSGLLSGCSVVSEDPAGAGFGHAALKVEGRARINAETAAGASRARLRFTVRFRLEENGAPSISVGGEAVQP